eukprot:TRINITY_DN6104_c0_g1_i1.p2 TRINITY_DN6104_c0_g1~~TRINITY_DN6104_c0_g1_i1.p2  ORF type:complete len:380 (-),score=79.75 TRINITY_DN6104_c0_g1_i1:79-1218(-)
MRGTRNLLQNPLDHLRVHLHLESLPPIPLPFSQEVFSSPFHLPVSDLAARDRILEDGRGTKRLLVKKEEESEAEILNEDEPVDDLEDSEEDCEFLASNNSDSRLNRSREETQDSNMEFLRLVHQIAPNKESAKNVRDIWDHPMIHDKWKRERTNNGDGYVNFATFLRRKRCVKITGTNKSNLYYCTHPDTDLQDRSKEEITKINKTNRSKKRKEVHTHHTFTPAEKLQKREYNTSQILTLIQRFYPNKESADTGDEMWENEDIRYKCELGDINKTGFKKWLRLNVKISHFVRDEMHYFYYNENGRLRESDPLNSKYKHALQTLLEIKNHCLGRENSKTKTDLWEISGVKKSWFVGHDLVETVGNHPDITLEVNTPTLEL